VALSLFPPTFADAFVNDPGAIVQTCTPDTPKVCMSSVHAAFLPGLPGPAREALQVISAKLPNPPTRVIEYVVPHDGERPPQPADAIVVEFDSIVEQPSGADDFLESREQLRWDLLDGAGTGHCSDEFDERTSAARLVAAAWLIGELPPGETAVRSDDLRSVYAALPVMDPAVAPLVRRSLKRLNSLPPDQQQARVAALREAALACDGQDLMDVLTGSGAGGAS
jgi:hypothetical protein